MGDWPKVVNSAIRSMESDGTSSVLPSATTESHDDRLLACFQVVCHVIGNAHRAKIIQNIAAAAFHLCYLLWVHVLFPQ